jgi:hypothetical protein
MTFTSLVKPVLVLVLLAAAFAWLSRPRVDVCTDCNPLAVPYAATGKAVPPLNYSAANLVNNTEISPTSSFVTSAKGRTP